MDSYGKALGVVVVGGAARAVGRQFQQSQVQVVVADSLRALKFESLGARPVRASSSRSTKERWPTCAVLQLEGKIIEIDSAGIIRLR